MLDVHNRGKYDRDMDDTMIAMYGRLLPPADSFESECWMC